MEQENSNSVRPKKKFDKKKWRENKYSNKAKVEKWQDKKNVHMQRKYFRMLKKSGGSANNPNMTPLGDRTKKTPAQGTTSYKQVKLEFERRQKQNEKRHKQDERKRIFQEKQEAMKAYKEKKADRFKTLSKKTSRGQPLMAGRIEMLLEKIKETTD